MSKYRPVDVRVWTDRKVSGLSPEAKLLWLFLLTAPSSIAIPGVVIGGDAALAEQLGVTQELFGQLFRQLFQSGLSVLREGRLIWLPKALKYQPPRNPNMLKAWAACWDDVPENNLKHQLWEDLKIACKSWNALFRQLFAEPLTGLLPEQEAKQLSQEQEQEQEQEQKEIFLSPSAPTEPTKRSGKTNSRRKQIPPDWKPNDAGRRQAEAAGLSLEDQAARFSKHYRATGAPRKDWDEAFSIWLDNAPRFAERGRRPGSSGGSLFEAAMESVRLAEERERKGDA